jgi:hypothetical protein
MVIMIKEHKLIVNLLQFSISHIIGEHHSQFVINANNLLSIESTMSKGHDSKLFVLENESELWNEKNFNGLEEKIDSGPQAISLDFQVAK